MITVNTRPQQVTGRKLEAKMRNLVFDKLVAELLQVIKKNMLNLLQEVKVEHIGMATWHLMGMGIHRGATKKLPKDSESNMEW